MLAVRSRRRVFVGISLVRLSPLSLFQRGLTSAFADDVISGGIFPLVTTQMYNGLGFGPASSLLGGIGTLLTVVPWILVFYGPRIRARSKFASEIMDT
jgi:hypothetical protein